MLITVISCKKEDVISNGGGLVQKQQKWNIDEGYPFILPESMQPYQYAVYQEDEDMLFDYIQSTLENTDGEDGYFTISFNADAFIYYSFITKTSRYYNPNIVIFPDELTDPDDDGDGDDDNGYVCMKWVIKESKTFDDKEKALYWAKKKETDDNLVSLSYNKKKGTYLVIVYEWEED